MRTTVLDVPQKIVLKSEPSAVIALLKPTYVCSTWTHVCPTWTHVCPMWTYVCPTWTYVCPTWTYVCPA